MEIFDNRKEEIISACEKLYEKENFKDISIKSISDETTFSRPSIYNYFQTKEEIFLAILQKEYDRWTQDLNKMYLENDKMSKEIFAENLAHTIEKRTKLLKLLSMNMYDIEENSRMEKLIEFKISYGNSIKEIKKCLDKFFANMSENDKDDFLFSFLPFMYGIYPYTFITAKQETAMKSAKIYYKHMSIYEMTYKGILKLLK